MAEIAFRDVRKNYGKLEVIHGVDLEVAAGEFIVKLGPSGCGKSTLLRMVAGLEAITSGTIEIGGKVANRLEPRERGCAMVFQNYALYPHMTVAENIGYALKIAGVRRAARRARVEAVASSLDLGGLLDRKPAQLSGGQRQRVAMGRAMIRSPRVFLYDEPLSNLDARLRVAMRIEIRKLHQKLGATTLFVTHDQVEAMTLADRIVVMNNGMVEQVGTPQEIYGRPATTYVAGFIGTPGLNLLRCSADPQSRTLVLADGQKLPYSPKQWPGLAAGPVIAGFRAEKVRIGEGGVKVRYEFSEDLGAARLFHGSVDGQTVIAHVAGRRPPSVGDELGFGIGAADLHLFAADTGRRLAEKTTDRPETDR